MTPWTRTCSPRTPSCASTRACRACGKRLRRAARTNAPASRPHALLLSRTGPAVYTRRCSAFLQLCAAHTSCLPPIFSEAIQPRSLDTAIVLPPRRTPARAPAPQVAPLAAPLRLGGIPRPARRVPAGRLHLAPHQQHRRRGAAGRDHARCAPRRGHRGTGAAPAPIPWRARARGGSGRVRGAVGGAVRSPWRSAAAVRVTHLSRAGEVGALRRF